MSESELCSPPILTEWFTDYILEGVDDKANFRDWVGDGTAPAVRDWLTRVRKQVVTELTFIHRTSCRIGDLDTFITEVIHTLREKLTQC